MVKVIHILGASGSGTTTLGRALQYIYAISVLFEDKLTDFYKRFGFNILCAGQMETKDIGSRYKADFSKNAGGCKY